MRIDEPERDVNFQPRKGIIMGESMNSNNNQTTKAMQDVMAERDQLCAEANRLRAEVAELRRALEEAQREVSDKAAIVAERDSYLGALYDLLGKDVVITPQDIAEIQKNGVDFGEIVAEIENDLRSRGLLNGN
jgi:uncharacterized protein YlxW (UPF0749 family)